MSNHVEDEDVWSSDDDDDNIPFGTDEFHHEFGDKTIDFDPKISISRNGGIVGIEEDKRKGTIGKIVRVAGGRKK